MIKKLASQKMLNYWGELPNPTEDFFYKNGISMNRALHDITYIPEIEAAIIAREAAVVGDKWQIIGKNDHTVHTIKTNILEINPCSIFRNIMESIWYGYTVLEHPIVKHNNTWYYEKIRSLPNDWFSFNKNYQLIPSNKDQYPKPIITKSGELDKEVELVQYRPSYTNPYGESQLARVFWSATWIRGDMELWASYIDRFGDDSILARTEISSPQKRQELIQAIKDFRSSGGMVIEGTDEFTLMKSEKNSSAELFRSFHEICVQQINKLILGHADALDSTSGQLGNNQGLSLVRQDITQDDKMMIAEVINRLIRHLCLVNKFEDIPIFVWIPEPENEKYLIERDQKLIQMGFELSENYIRKTYRFENDEIFKKRL